MAKTGAGGADNLDGGGGGGNGGGGGAPSQHQAVPVSEEVFWKAKAQEAQEQLGLLQARVSELEAALADADETIAQVQRRAQIDQELTAARAVDLETARLLTQAAVAEMDEPDVTLAVRELCERKPFLFACSSSGHAGVSMSPQSTGIGAHSLDAMATRARGSGNRAELLRYLRARRTP